MNSVSSKISKAQLLMEADGLLKEENDLLLLPYRLQSLTDNLLRLPHDILREENGLLSHPDGLLINENGLPLLPDDLLKARDQFLRDEKGLPTEPDHLLMKENRLPKLKTFRCGTTSAIFTHWVF